MTRYVFDFSEISNILEGKYDADSQLRKTYTPSYGCFMWEKNFCQMKMKTPTDKLDSRCYLAEDIIEPSSL